MKKLILTAVFYVASLSTARADVCGITLIIYTKGTPNFIDAGQWVTTCMSDADFAAALAAGLIAINMF